MTEHGTKGTPWMRSQVMNAVFRLQSSKQMDLGLILSYVTSLNDPTSLNLDSGSFSNRGNHFSQAAVGTEWKTVSENALWAIKYFPPLPPAFYLYLPFFLSRLHWRRTMWLPKSATLFLVLSLPAILLKLSQHGKVFLSSNLNGSAGIFKILSLLLS